MKRFISRWIEVLKMTAILIGVVIGVLFTCAFILVPVLLSAYYFETITLWSVFLSVLLFTAVIAITSD